MDNDVKDSINAFNRFISRDKIYRWESKKDNSGFIEFKLVELTPTLFSDNKVIVFVELLNYRYQGVSKKMISKLDIDVFRIRIMETLHFDLLIFSIDHTEIRIVNQSKFILLEKPKLNHSQFKFYTGRAGFDTLRESSYLFNDDRDDDIMSYTRLFGTNRFR
jgi:hypothetical protein